MTVHPTKLWHYTSREAFISIRSSGVIRATNIFYLNDSSEWHHAESVLADVLRQYSLTDTRDQILHVLVTDAFRLPAPRYYALANFYVVSFSELNDHLSQWRAYGRRGGVSIGFKYEDVRLLPAGKLDRCCYDETSQRESFRHKLDDWLNVTRSRLSGVAFKSTEEAWRHPCVQESVYEIVEELRRDATFVKHAKFESENEWRFVATTSSPLEVKLRCSESMLVPFVELALPPIETIVLGPSPHQQLNDLALYLVQGTQGWTIERSEIPYRDW